MNQKDKALEIHRRLVQALGEPPRHPHLDPVSELVCTIISQNTNDNLRDQAYNTLRQRFSTWEEVRDAPVQEVVDAIKIAGLGQTKAPHMQGALRRITAERGQLELEFLREMSVGEAKAWLTEMKGVGPKTAAIILLFSLDMPAFPVDTHVHRVSRRLGLIPPTASREKAHELLEAMLPPETYYPLHINLIRHGREVCGARKPRCEVCTLLDLCEYYQKAVS
jgi:endonuclease-3